MIETSKIMNGRLLLMYYGGATFIARLACCFLRRIRKGLLDSNLKNVFD